MKEREVISKKVIFVFLAVLIIFSLGITYFSFYYNSAKVYSENTENAKSAGQASVGLFVDREAGNVTK